METENLTQTSLLRQHCDLPADFHSYPPVIEPGRSSWDLAPGEIHLWLTTIDRVPNLSLSAAEEMQLSAIKLPFVARRFESSRKLLRYLLGLYLGCSECHIETTDRGKPFLSRFSEFYFSVSHSANIIVIALSRQPIGVDLERMRKLDMVSIAQRFFAPQELRFLQEKSYQGNQQAFFKLWTAKEAALKADGGGIASGMKKSIATMDEGRVTSITWKSQSWKISSWSLDPTGALQTENLFARSPEAANNCVAPVLAPETPCSSLPSATLKIGSEFLPNCINVNSGVEEGERADYFFGAIASASLPTVIHWYDFRTFDRISN